MLRTFGRFSILWFACVMTADSRAEESPATTWLRELQSPDPVAREVAVQRLIELGAQVPLSELSPLLEDAGAPSVQLAARRVYGGIVGLSPEQAQRVKQRIYEVQNSESSSAAGEAARWMLEQGDGAVEFALATVESSKSPPLIALRRRVQTLVAIRALNDGRNLQDAAAKGLHELGEPVVQDLAVLAQDGSLRSDWRRVATERLVFLAGERALGTALRLATNDDPALRRMAVNCVVDVLPKSQFAGAAHVLFSTLHDDATMASAFSRLGDRLGAESLRPHLESKSASARGLASRLLGEQRDEESRSPLRRLLQDEDTRVVAAAVTALGRIGDDDDLGSLVDTLSHTEPQVRRSTVGAIAMMGGDRACAWLSTSLRDDHPSVRAAAARALGQVGDSTAVGVLVHSLEDSEPSVVAAATASLASLTGDRNATALVVSTASDRKRARRYWDSWWRDRLDATDDTADEEEEEPEDLATPLAGEGRRILNSLAQTLRSQFRPYAELKERNGTATPALLQAALKGMREVVFRKEDAENPDQLVLTMDADDRRVLQALLERGKFQDAGDLAGIVGTLPMPIPAGDYILLVYEAAESMVDSLGDRFTRLEMTEDASGKVDPDKLPSLFGKGKSLGMLIDKSEASLQVEFVMALSAADRAGLRPGDKIISVNGELAAGMERLKLNRILREPVDLNVLRDGWTRPVAFHLEPEEADPEQLVTTAMLPGKIGYLRLQQFDLGCAQKVEWGLRELENQGMEALVFDLRGNPGGTVLDAVAIVDKFVGRGETITTTWVNSRDEDEDYAEEAMKSTDSDTDRTYPMAVLVDKCSASASEMTSGALQDLERSITVGRTTWGKGIGQSGAAVAGFSRPSVFGETRSQLSLGSDDPRVFLAVGTFHSGHRCRAGRTGDRGDSPRRAI